MTAIESIESNSPPPGPADDVGDEPIMFNGTAITPGTPVDKLLELGFYDLNDPEDKEDYEFLKGLEDDSKASELRQREAAEAQRLQRELHPEPEEPLEMTSSQRKQLEFNMTHMGMDELLADPFTQWVKANFPDQLAAYVIPKDFPGLTNSVWTLQNETTVSRHSKASVVLESAPPKYPSSYNPDQER
jgi:hypothetical protein